VDAGGGSGRLIERVLDRFQRALGLVIDQSEAFFWRLPNVCSAVSVRVRYVIARSFKSIGRHSWMATFRLSSGTGRTDDANCRTSSKGLAICVLKKTRSLAEPLSHHRHDLSKSALSRSGYVASARITNARTSEINQCTQPAVANQQIG